MDGTSLEGQWATDKTCATKGDEGSCATDFLFSAIWDQSGLNDYEDGIIGMWSGNLIDEYSNPDVMFMNTLMETGDLSEKTFSFYLTGLDGESYIDFGTPNKSVMDGEVVYIDSLENHSHWTANVTAYRFHSSFDVDKSEWGMSSGVNLGITDTGSSCISGPSDEMNFIYSTIIKNIALDNELAFDEDWGFTFDCPITKDQPIFELLFGGYWMQVLPEDYIVDISIDADGSICSLCLDPDQNANEWLLGDAFMRGWYNIHDHTNMQMGFVPFKGSNKSGVVAAPTGVVYDKYPYEVEEKEENDYD